MPRHQRIAVYGLCREGDRVLLARAAPYLTVAGRWFLPGGGLLHGEDPVDGLVREFAEETGLDITPGPLLGVLSDLTTLPDGARLHTVRLIYEVASWAGELRAETDGSTDAVAWAGPAELAERSLMPYVAEALARWPANGSDRPPPG
jgi:ADP-ribose pyrophosphatase YjhB (NUDIX family)